MRKPSKGTLLLAVVLCFSLLIAGCGTGGNGGPQADKGDTVKLVYVTWACATATTNVIADILENEMGYKVEMIPLTAGAMYQGLASKNGDAMFCCWLPVTHGEYMKQVGDKVEDLGPNMHGARIGLVVPEYVTINSIEELNSVKDKFDGQIIGIDPGAGIMKATNQALQDYGLNYTVMEGSDATMVGALKTAIDKKEWVAVTGWTPHWKFARWDLKYLDDPKKVYGEEETINTVVRQGLKEDMPEVYELFDNFAWTSDDLSRAMVLAEETKDGKKAARQWVKENQDLVNSWLPEKYQK